MAYRMKEKEMKWVFSEVEGLGGQHWGGRDRMMASDI